MRVVVQKCREGKCIVRGKTISEIDKGLVLLVGFTDSDNKDTILKMVNKIVNLRIFNDENGVMNLSIKDVKGKILSISQFTLYADTTKGNNEIIPTKAGIFGEDMEIVINNMGPTTIILER